MQTTDLIKGATRVDCFHLISDFEDAETDKDTYGIGVGFEYKGKYGRIAIRIPNNATYKEIKEAWTKLEHAVANPLEAESKVAWGDEVLTGKELNIINN